MSVCKQMLLLKLTGTCFSSNIKHRCLHVSVLQGSVATWRLKQGLPAKGKEYGPITDLPDWSYADGRPAPFNEGQKRRIRLHKEYYDQIRKLTKEVDECMDLNHQKASREEEQRRNAIQNRLKQKRQILQ